MPDISQTSKVFNLHIDRNKVSKVFADMNTALQIATINSLNKIGRAANRSIATDIKTNYNITSKTLKIGRTVKLITASKFLNRPVFTISILKKPRGLFVYSPLKTKEGISVKVSKNRKTIRRSYILIAKKRGGKKFVARKDEGGGTVQRTSRSGKSYKAPKSKFLFGPSLAQLYSRKRIRVLINKEINEKYEAELASQFNKQFEKRKK
jgi:hypothetical protein